MTPALLLLALMCDEAGDLIAQLRASKDLGERYRLSSALGQAAKPEHVPLLLRETDAGPAEIRVFLVRALGRFRDEHAQAALRQLCGRHEIPSRAEAAFQLRLAGSAEGAKTIAGLLGEAKTPEEKREVLQRMYGTGGSGVDAIRALDAYVAKEADAQLRRIAVQALGSHPDAEAAQALQKIAGKADDPHRHEALAGLIRHGDGKALDEGLRVLEEGKAPALSAYALINAIQSRNDRAVLPRLRALLERSTNVTVRTALIRTLAVMKDKESVPLLTTLSNSDDAAVAKAALTALQQIEGRSGLDLSRQAGSSDDPYQRLEASEKLLQRDDPRGFDGLKSVLEKGAASHRQRAIAILSNSRRRESADLLVGLVEDSDAQVAQAARGALVTVLSALYPYQKFDAGASPASMREWWSRQRSK